jgi:tetratricopeptide (TPR) repeat protein
VNLRLGALLAAVLAVLTFAGTIGYDFVYDDHPVVVSNPAAHDPLDWRAIATRPSWGGATFRPLTVWTFAVQWALHGPSPAPYHMVNVALHAAVAALLVLVVGSVGASPLVATVAGILFAIHPVHVDAVASIVGRAELLCAFFVLLAIAAHHEAGRRGWPPLAIAGVAVAVAAGLLTKEYAFTLVVALPVFDLLVVDDGSPRRFLRALPTRRGLAYAAVALVAGVWLALRHAVLGSSALLLEPWMNPLAAAPDGVRVLTALKVQAMAVRLLFVPLGLRPDYSGDTIPLVLQTAEPAALGGIAVAAAIVALGACLLRADRHALFWLVLSGLAWAVVSNIVTPVWTIFGERLLYLPSAGFCVLVATALVWGAQRLGRNAAVWTVVGAIVLAAVPFAWTEHAIWHSDLTLARAMAGRAPRSAHALHVLGSTYAKRGQLEHALAEFDAAVTLDPTYAASFYNAALARRARREYATARALLRRTVRLAPSWPAGWVALIATEIDLGRPERALALADHALWLTPGVPALEAERALALRALAAPPARAAGPAGSAPRS